MNLQKKCSCWDVCSSHLVQLLRLPAAVLLAHQPQQQEGLRVPAPPPPPPVRRPPRLRLCMPRRLLCAEALLHSLRSTNHGSGPLLRFFAPCRLLLLERCCTA